ncbi:MAG: histidinol dehydrogenase [Bacteroidota bacterium]|nr:histidinol dehydrogenase [Bacteroidota bacterium]
MNIIRYPEKKDWNKILERPSHGSDTINKAVAEVLNDVKVNGDEAVRRYTEKFDKVRVENLLVSEEEFNEAECQVDDALKQSIQVAKINIEKFHSAQKMTRKVIETTPGVFCWQKSVAIEKVGLYIPGGSAPLFSTVLMLGIPAIMAGCKEIILCTPPNKEGKIHPAILYTAKLIGLTQVYKIGGIQSVAAMTFGTESISKVSKIFGPGNQWVTAAKQAVTTHGVAIDMPAGPSEVAIMADHTAVPAFIAADLLSQAEHGPDSQVILFTCQEEILEAINKELDIQLNQLPRKEIAVKALTNSKTIILKSMDEMLEIVNEYASEHLIIALENAVEVAEQIVNAGSVFIGNYSPESAGDYASGTNHALPTAGYAKSYSGVNLDSFIKKITFQQINPQGFFTLGPVIEVMAEAEELFAHKNAATVRLNAIKKES